MPGVLSIYSFHWLQLQLRVHSISEKQAPGVSNWASQKWEHWISGHQWKVWFKWFVQHHIRSLQQRQQKTQLVLGGFQLLESQIILSLSIDPFPILYTPIQLPQLMRPEISLVQYTTLIYSLSTVHPGHWIKIACDHVTEVYIIIHVCTRAELRSCGIYFLTLKCLTWQQEDTFKLNFNFPRF